MKTLKTILALVAFATLNIELGTLNCFAQISSVRMDVAHGGLHCPILGPQLKEQITKLENAKNINFNRKDSYIEFEIPTANLPAEEKLIKMANDLGYPREDIKVTISKVETK